MKQMIIEVIKTNKKAIIAGAVGVAGLALFEVAKKVNLNKSIKDATDDDFDESIYDDAEDVEFTEEEKTL